MDNPITQPDDPKELLRRLEQAERQIAALQATFQTAANMHDAQVNELAARLNSSVTRRPNDHPLRPFLIAEITDQDEEAHAWGEQYITGDGVVDFVDGRTSGNTAHTSAAFEINNWLNLPTTQKALMFEYPLSAESRYAFAFTPPPPPVQDGTIDYVATYTDGAWEWVEIEECAEDGDVDDGEVV